MSSPAVQFAALLRQRREAAGLSQGQVAVAAGTTPTTVKNLEHARVARPLLGTLIGLCAVPALQLHVDDVLAHFGYPGPPPARDKVVCAPGWDPIRLSHSLSSQLYLGRGGVLDSLYLTLDSGGAADALAYAAADPCARAARELPWRPLREAVIQGAQ